MCAVKRRRLGLVAAIGAAGLLITATATATPTAAAQAGPELATLELRIGTPAGFGAFTPGAAKTYVSSTTALVNSTADAATLTVHDGTGIVVGRLVNGQFSLPEALQVLGRNATTSTTTFADVPGPASPLALLTYPGPISNDAISISYSQHIGASDALLSGTYAKALTLTLSTTMPCAMSVTVTANVSGTVEGGGGSLQPGPTEASASCTPNPPDCSRVSAAPGVILPATRDQLKLVTLSGATDADDDPLGYQIDTVTQDEPITGAGDDTSPDAQRSGDQVLVRAERNPKGDGRVYRIAFTVTDSVGISCTGTTQVSVPRQKGTTTVDGGDVASWDSFNGQQLLG